MCGITGAVWSDPGKAIDACMLNRMTNVLRHRGPDDSGAYRNEMQGRPGRGDIPGVALGFRRLSIIDVQGGHQPVSNEDGTVTLVCNGEIYNHAQLRKRLDGSGHTFRSRCDIEPIVHLYEDLGVEFLDHLVGMFALALWDGRSGKLILARDRLGQKPLVYRHDQGRLAFASELKSLLQLGDIPREVDPGALDAYLTYQYVPHPGTILRGFQKLPPGHYATYEKDQLTVSPYWQVSTTSEKPLTEREYVHRVRETLTESVRLRMQSDVPLGAFLSGGMDSSITVALMSQLSPTPVKTFSIGFPVAEYDETQWARKVANHLGTEHHEFQVTPEVVDILPRLVWHFDEPFADSSAIPTWYVSQLAREHVAVSLSGDGGDELFAGYPRYRAVQLASFVRSLPRPLRSLFSNRLWQYIPAGNRQKSLLRRAKRFMEALGKQPDREYLEWISIFNEQRRAELYQEDFVRRLPPEDPGSWLSKYWRSHPTCDSVTSASLTDLATYLPCDLMTKVDMASMAHSLECRQPFLDHRLVELAVDMPIRWKIRGRQSKWILRQAFGDLIPATVFQRRKMGFGVPLAHWFRNELGDMTRDVLLDSRVKSRGYFMIETIRRLIDEHQKGDFDHGYRLWSLLIFELWAREWID